MADPTLTISTENVCSIIVKAREFEMLKPYLTGRWDER